MMRIKKRRLQCRKSVGKRESLILALAPTIQAIQQKLMSLIHQAHKTITTTTMMRKTKRLILTS